MNKDSPSKNKATDAEKTNSDGVNNFSPSYWRKALDGTPAAIFYPAYIRFLQGLIVMHNATLIIIGSKIAAESGDESLKKLIDDLDNSPDSKQHGSSFESFFASALFVNLISEVEQFFVTCAETAIRTYPKKVGSTTFSLSDVLGAASTEELIERAANKALQGLMYEKPADYLSGLCKLISIDEKKLLPIWPSFVEMKARRDLGVHNNWIANETYIRKLREVDFSNPPAIGVRLIPDLDYLGETVKIAKQLVREMGSLMAENWLPPGYSTFFNNAGKKIE
jgi:hypothetical protein